MALTLAPPRPTGPDADREPDQGVLVPDLASRFTASDLAFPVLNPAPVLNSAPLVAAPAPVVAPGPGSAVPDPRPRLPTTGEPDDIITWYVRPRRRRRRRRLAVAFAAVLAAATVWAGLVIGPGSPAVPRPPGRAHTPQAKAVTHQPVTHQPVTHQPVTHQAVIHMARARQHRRRQRIAQTAADTVTAVGGEAAARLYHPGRPGTRQPPRGRPKLPAPGPGPAGLTGVNVLGRGCGSGVAGIVSESRAVLVICGDGSMFGLDGATGAFATRPQSQLLDELASNSAVSVAVAADGRHIWVTDLSTGSTVPGLSRRTAAVSGWSTVSAR